MEIEHKAYPIVEMKRDDQRGVIEAYVSVFNNTDSGNEIVRPGFFSKSIQRKLPKGVWAHDWKQPIAKTLEAREVPPGDPSLPPQLKDLGATYIKGQFNLETQRGREAYSDIKFGIVDEFSIGYKVIKESKSDDGARELLEGDWKEWSPVLVGMNPETSLISVKDEKAMWSTAMQNNLPDSSFAYIEPGGSKDSDGKTTPRSLRHFPYKDANGKPDAAHVRNALARIPQSNVSAAAKASALTKVRAAAKTLGIDTGKSDTLEIKGLFEQGIEESNESMSFLYGMLCSATSRAQMLSDAGAGDIDSMLDDILSEFSARWKAAFGSAEESEPDEALSTDYPMMVGGDDQGTMADVHFNFKGDLRSRLPFAKHAETVQGAVEVFANRSAALKQLVTELVLRRKSIEELRETKAGAMYSSTNMQHMKRIHEAIGQAASDLSATYDDMAALINRGDASQPRKSDAAVLRAQSLRIQSEALMHGG